MSKASVGGAKRPDAAADNAWKKQKPKASWPAAGSAEVSLATGGRAGKLPVTVSPADTGLAKSALLQSSPAAGVTNPGRVKVAVADKAAARKAGVDGVLLSLGRSDGIANPVPAKVEVDYNSFRQAYGGDYAARLHLVELPACALTTPERAECRTQKPLQTKNDTRTGKLSTRVSTPATTGTAAKSGQKAMSAAAAASGGAMVLAATAGAAGPTGDYKATPLQASGSWSAGGSTGAFNWSYPMGVPSVPGGLQPELSLDYSSQAVDGKTSASNNQPGWIGDGWDWQPGFVERRYKSCNDDKTGGTNTTKIGDLCWFNDNATLNLGGKTSELVFEQGKGWHPARDSGEKVEKLTGATNGDNDGEHWKVTTADGTQYFFGLNRLPGWKDASTPTTNSAWTVPVFGNQAGEPCYNASFAKAWCQQAWRWQLDYVVDVRGNAMAYYWNAETNNYGRNVSETAKSTPTQYIRGGWLDHIDYGLRSDAVYSAKAMGQVKFDVSERCLGNCGTFDETNAKNWPDTPFDMFCKDGSTECKDQHSPSFWSRKRLTSVTTKLLTAGAYKDVDTWTLTQGFPAAGDGISTPMWLESVQRTGKVGGSTSTAPVRFAGVQKANRVDKTGDGLAPFIRLRLYQITTETGGTIGVDYSDPECTTSTLPKPDATNTTRCYPVKWAFEGSTAKEDWFNSYVTTRVIEGDNLAETPDKVTSYSYLDGAAWAKNTDEFTKPEDRVHSIARGYGRVQTRTGAANDPKTLSEARYFRGIDGAAVKDSEGVAVTDREQFAGMKREVATYNGDDTAKLVTATSTTPWRSSVTATRARAGLPALEAYRTGTEKEATRTRVTGGDRKTELTRHFDEYGMVDSVSESGDTSKTGDERCTTTAYARNTANWLLSLTARSETVAVACGEPVNRPADVIEDSRTLYDNAAFGAAPTKGLVTQTEKINGDGVGYSPVNSVPSTCGPAKNQLCYDEYGRPSAGADALGKVTQTAFTPASGEVPTKTVVTNSLGHAVTTVLEPLRAQPVQATDANGKVTATAYDPLGRVTKVWLPTRSAVTYPDSPNFMFDYLIRNDGPNVITTKSLNHESEYRTSYTFYDGLLRPRQTQETSPDLAGRLVSENFFDTRGLQWRTSNGYYATGAPEPVLVKGQELKYPASTDTEYDGAGRATAVISRKFGDETKRTSTSYTGDTTTVIPPKGGTAVSTVVDALGRTTARTEYTKEDLTAGAPTLFAFDRLGRLDNVTDPSGAKWTYRYDVRGRQTRVEDPDKGASTTTYDVADRPVDTTDARGITLRTEYDELGRRTALKKDGTTLSAWVYDTVAKGQLSKSTRYVGGKAYETAITTYNGLYQPVNTQVTIPDSEGALANTYKWTTSYNANTGQPVWTKHPAIGGLPQETVTTGYTHGSGLTASMGAGTDSIISDVTYDHYGRSLVESYGAFGQTVSLSNTYDEHTGALTDTYLDKETAPQRVEDTHYTQDPAGNVTAISTSTGQGTSRTTDTQCFRLDPLRRITDAWTSTAPQCSAAPSAGVVGGSDAYWTSYTYDAVGNRKTETRHTTASGPAADTVRTYQAPKAGTHQLPGVKQTGTDAHDESFAYDQVGNTRSRTIGSSVQDLSWDEEGRLKSVKEGANTSEYLYDPAGQRLVSRDSTGTTLYLPAGNELRLDKTGNVVGTRYYGPGTTAVAVRTQSKLVFQFNDRNGTGTTQITADAAQTVSRRKSTVFGAVRGASSGGWTGNKGFVGGTKDADSKLTHLGAREYDPLLGRFISVDPLLEFEKGQSLSGYSYAENNPTTTSDPTGRASMISVDCSDGCGEQWDFIESHVSPNFISGETWESKFPVYKTLKSKTTVYLKEMPRPRKYQYEAPNGVCVWAAASSCAPYEAPPTTESVPDLPCPEGDSPWVCRARSEMFKFGLMTGMTGGSLGMFALRPGTRWNQLMRVPEGLTKAQFSEVEGVFKSQLKTEGNVVVQGSRVTGNITGGSDIDFAVRVTPETFDRLIAARWKNPNPGSQNEATRDHAIKTGKITAGDARPKLSPIRDQVSKILGDDVDHVDVSIIKIGGAFDNGPFINVK
ncbi:RHS repeat-associated core domain-containing protein [Streptomyces sp. NPDC001903]|uniref:RHS repeat-associated core domain-containing protein n=1 Tax=Streptomyces sp. NPDC001903 TaxID=3364622 RepID=UPI0036A75160